MLKRERYKLSKNLTALKLRKNGFKNGTYRCNVYKDMFYFLMVIDEDNNDWSYQVVDKEDNMMDQMMEAEGVTEELKGKDQMEWLRRVNNIRNRVDEVILNELVYV